MSLAWKHASSTLFSQPHDAITRPACFVLLLAALAALAPTASAQTPLATSFSFQGYLADNGAPADGPFEFQFLLYDDPTGVRRSARR